MKYYVKLVMEGEFPGSPDTDTFEVSEKEYSMIHKYFAQEEPGINQMGTSMTQKIAINKCYGGFGLSIPATLEYYRRKNGAELHIYTEQRDPQTRMILRTKGGLNYHHKEPEDIGERDWMCIHFSTLDKPAITDDELNDHYFDYHDIPRDDPILTSLVEEMGSDVNSRYANLIIVEIPDGVKWTVSEYDGWETVEEEHRSWG
jgi:hypothetical protein